MIRTIDRESINAIRMVRIAAHDLENACRTLVGGVPMAISQPTAPDLGLPVRGLAPTGKPFKVIQGGRRDVAT